MYKSLIVYQFWCYWRFYREPVTYLNVKNRQKKKDELTKHTTKNWDVYETLESENTREEKYYNILAQGSFLHLKNEKYFIFLCNEALFFCTMLNICAKYSTLAKLTKLHITWYVWVRKIWCKQSTACGTHWQREMEFARVAPCYPRIQAALEIFGRGKWGWAVFKFLFHSRLWINSLIQNNPLFLFESWQGVNLWNWALFYPPSLWLHVTSHYVLHSGVYMNNDLFMWWLCYMIVHLL